MTALPPFPWSDVLIILALVFLNGAFAMAELAIVSARSGRLRGLADKGNAGARAALRLAADPGRFLSTVQIGITLIGILAGAYSGASLGGPVGARLEQLGIERELSETLGFAGVIALTTYLSLVIGELVPKHLALLAAEPIAMVVALPMEAMARIAGPLVWLLDRSSSLVLKLMRVNRAGDERVTAEELHLIIAEATRSGVIEEEERAIMSGVVRLADRPVREVMTPRPEVDWIELSASDEEVRAKVLDSPHSLLPVAEGTVDRIVGVAQAREILARFAAGQPLEMAQLIRRAEIVPDQLDALDTLKVLRSGEVSMALVHDEYGHFDGIVTPADILAAIAGEFVSHRDVGSEPMIVEREDGSLLVSGSMPADQMAERLGIVLSDDRDYATTAGHVLAVLRRLPEEGDSFEDQGWRFEVVDMDGRKIDKLLVAPLPAEELHG